MSNSVNEWIETCELTLKMLKKRKPKDRLDLIAAIEECNTALNASTIGWNSWLKSPTLMNKFSEPELLEIFKTFQKFAMEFLEHDLKWTKTLQKKNKKGKRKKKEKKGKQIYIS